MAIVTGLDPRVFDGPAPPDALRYSHYVASGLILLVASCLLLWVRRWLGWLWIVVTVAYCSTFLASDLSDDLDVPSEVYIATEYALYLTMGVVVLLMPPDPSLAALEELRVVDDDEQRRRVNVLARERAAERQRR